MLFWSKNLFAVFYAFRSLLVGRPRGEWMVHSGGGE